MRGSGRRRAPQRDFEITARGLLRPLGVGANSIFGGGGSLLDLVEGKLAVFASADGSEVSLFATLIDLCGPTGVEPRESCFGRHDCVLLDNGFPMQRALSSAAAT